MFRRRRFSERREWLGVTQVAPISVAVGTLSFLTLVTQAQMEEYPGARLSFMHCSLFVSPATAPAAATGYGIFIGVLRRANVGGAAPQPDPEVNLDFGWIYWNVFFPQIGGTAAADSNASRWIGYFRADIIQRLRLRWHEFDDLTLVVKNSANSGAAIQYSLGARFRVSAGRK